VSHDSARLRALRQPLGAFKAVLLDLSLRADPAALHEVRRSVVGLTDQLGIHGERAQELQMAVGEALSNAIAHAYASTPGLIRLRAQCTRTDLVVEVEDHGRWQPRRLGRKGYGLRLMRALMDHVRVNSTAGGTTVTLRLALRNGHRKGR